MDNVTFEHYQLKQSPREELIDKIKAADIVVVNMAPFDAEVVGAMEKCLLLIRHGIGYDNVDVPACTANRIRFAYQPDYCATEVAEQAVSLIMACARKLFISPATVATHIARVRAKYTVTGRAARTKTALFARFLEDGHTRLQDW